MTYRTTSNELGFDYSNDYAALAARSGNRTIQAYFEDIGWIDCEPRDVCDRFQRIKNFRSK